MYKKIVMKPHDALIPFALEQGWEFLPQNPTQEKNGELRFRDEEGIVTFAFWRSGTVGRFENGKQQFVRNLTHEDMEELLVSPNYFESLLESVG